MEHYTLLETYRRTEEGLRRRTKELREQMREMDFPERDLARKRLAVMQEELSDVELIRMELNRRHEEGRGC